MSFSLIVRCETREMRFLRCCTDSFRYLLTSQPFCGCQHWYYAIYWSNLKHGGKISGSWAEI